MMFQSNTGFNPLSDIRPHSLHYPPQPSQSQGFFPRQNGAQATPRGQVYRMPFNYGHSSAPITDSTLLQESSVGYQTFQDKQSRTLQYQKRCCYIAQTEHCNQECCTGGVQYSRFANERSWSKDYSGSTDNIVLGTSRFYQAGEYQTELNTPGNLAGMEDYTNNCNQNLVQRQTATNLHGVPGNPPSMNDHTNNWQNNLAKSQTATRLPQTHYITNANSHVGPTTTSNGGQRHAVRATITQASWPHEILRNPTPKTRSARFMFTCRTGESYVVTCNKVDNYTATPSTRMNVSRPPLRKAHFVTNNPQHVTRNRCSTPRLGTAPVNANTNTHNVDHPLIHRPVIRSVSNPTYTDTREFGLQPVDGVVTSSARTAPQEQANHETSVTDVLTETVFNVSEPPATPVNAPQSSMANMRNSETCVSHTKDPSSLQDFWEFINSPQISPKFAAASVIANTNTHNVEHSLLLRSVIRSVSTPTSTNAREIGLQNDVATSSARTAPQEQANNETRDTDVLTEAVFKFPEPPTDPVKAPQSSMANMGNSETCVSHKKKPAISQDFWEFINSPQVSPKFAAASVIANTNTHNVEHPLLLRSVIRSVSTPTSTDAREIGLQDGVATLSARTASQEQANNETRDTDVLTEAVFKFPEPPTVPVKAPQSSMANMHNSETCVSHKKKPAISQDFWEFINSPQVSHNFADDEDEVKFWVPDPEIWKQDQDCRRRSSDDDLKIHSSHLVDSPEICSHDKAHLGEMSTSTRSCTPDASHHKDNLDTDHCNITSALIDVAGGIASSDKNKLQSHPKLLVQNFQQEPIIINNVPTQKTAEQISPSFETAASLMPLHNVDVVGLKSANEETSTSPDCRLDRDDYEKEDVPVILNVFSLKNQDVDKSIPEETNQSPEATVNCDDSDDSFALYICDEDSSSPTKQPESDTRPHDKLSDNVGKENVKKVGGKKKDSSAKSQDCSIDELQSNKDVLYEKVVEPATLVTEHDNYLLERTIQKAQDDMTRERNLENVRQIEHSEKETESPTVEICDEDSCPTEENKESSTSTPTKLMEMTSAVKSSGVRELRKWIEKVENIEKVTQSFLGEKNSPKSTTTANVLCSRNSDNFLVSSGEKNKSQFCQKERNETPSMVERLAKLKKKYQHQKLSRIKFLSHLPISRIISTSRTRNPIDNEKRKKTNGMFKGESIQRLHKHMHKGNTPLRQRLQKLVNPTLNTATLVNNGNMGHKENVTDSVRDHKTVKNGIQDIAQRKILHQERLKTSLVNVSDISEDEDNISQEHKSFESYKTAYQNHIPVHKSFPEKAAASVAHCATNVNTSTPDNSNDKTCPGNLMDRPRNRLTDSYLNDSNERTLLLSILEVKNTTEMRRGSIETENSWPFLHPDDDSVLGDSDAEGLDSEIDPFFKRLRTRYLSSEDHDWPKSDGVGFHDFSTAPNMEDATCFETSSYLTTKRSSKNSLDFTRKRKISENGYAENALVPCKIRICHSNEKDPVALNLKKSVMPKHSVQLSCETLSQTTKTRRQTDSKSPQTLDTEESHTAKILVLDTKESVVESALQRKIPIPTTVNFLQANSIDSKSHPINTKQSSDVARMGNWRPQDFSERSLKPPRHHMAQKPVVPVVSREDRGRNVFLAMQNLIKMGVIADTESIESNSTPECEKRESPLSEDGSIFLESESTREDPESRQSTHDGEQSVERDSPLSFVGEPMCYKEEDLVRQIEADNAVKKESQNQNCMPDKPTSSSNQRLIPDKDADQEFSQTLQYTFKGIYRSPNGKNVRWYTREEFTLNPCAVKIRRLNIKKKTIKIHRSR